MKSLLCNIPQHSRSYEIRIQKGIINDTAAIDSLLSGLGSRFAIVTDEQVAPIFGQNLSRSLTVAGLECYLFAFPAGEKNKTRRTKEVLEDQLFEKGLGADTCIIALGGGVVTDLVGFLAATYSRGVPLVMIPTTLMGMVDASLGGKTGVNVPYGKNLVGVVYHPKNVIIDPLSLEGLPKRELKNGIVEMIKHGLIADAAYFKFLAENVESLLALEEAVIEHAIFESCRIKTGIIEQDDRDKGKRNLLNFGHTVGHALEVLTQYTVPHGVAVAIGLLVESHLAVKMGFLAAAVLDEIKAILERYDISLSLPFKFTIQEVIDAMALDKKSLKGKPHFVMIKEVGSPVAFGGAYCTTVPDNLLKSSLQWMFETERGRGS